MSFHLFLEFLITGILTKGFQTSNSPFFFLWSSLFDETDLALASPKATQDLQKTVPSFRVVFLAV